SDKAAPVLNELRPLVFVSHDSRDAELAEAFSNLLTDASGGFLKSFRSSDRKGTAGIEFGAEWYNAIMGKIDDATDVVALLTANSIDRPWILYEAGVAKGKLNKQVFGVVVGISLEQASRGPFAQFQNCGDDDDSLTKLVLQLIRRNLDAEPRDEAVRRQVNAFRENVTDVLHLPSNDQNEKISNPNNVSKLFEEIKVVLGDLPDKLNLQLTEALSSRPLRRRKRFHPYVLADMLHMSMDSRDPKQRTAVWLMFTSFLREEFPWLYEPAMEVYRVMKRERPVEIRTAMERFARSVEISTHPMFMEMMMDTGDHETLKLIRNLPDMIHRLLDGLIYEEPEVLVTNKRKPTQAKH
ncbi:MAG TPA: TIR domain-containing protein, partial [Pyrinomonadaceae bacterium]|nr:TIR domain-containing protein [Pyrinomonadaceae bacterium]